MYKVTFLLCVLLSVLSFVTVQAQEREPRFPGCDDKEDVDCADIKMMQFIFSNLVHPEAAKSANIKGTVSVSFLVKGSGEIDDIVIDEGLGHGCDEEVIRLVKLMPKWLPATSEEGTIIDMRWGVDVKFVH